MPEDLVLRIDRVRGDVPFERWARSAFEAALAGAPTPLPSIRDSASIKRDVRPVRKEKGK